MVEEITLKKGALVIKQGDDRDRFLYIVKKGKLTVQRMVSGSIVNCGYAREGDIFGEVSMITGAIRAATIMSAEDGVVVLRMDKSSFLAMIRVDPEIAWKVLTNLAIKTQMLDEIQEQVSDPAVLRKMILGQN